MSEWEQYDPDPEYIEQFKEIFQRSLNKVPDYVADLTYLDCVYENISRRSNIRNTIIALLLPLLSNVEYVNILFDKGFVNFSLEKGNLKITNFINDYGIDDSIKEVMQIITKMDFEIIDDINKSVIDGYIEYIYDKTHDNGEMYIELGESIDEYAVYPNVLDEKYYNSDLIEKTELLQSLKEKNSSLLNILYCVERAIGDPANYLIDNKRSIFIIDNSDKNKPD